MSELKSCPFCGGEAAMQAPNMHRRTCIACKRCGMSTKYCTPEEAAAAWNRRTQPANEPLTLKELRKMSGEPIYKKQLEKDPYEEAFDCWAIVGEFGFNRAKQELVCFDNLDCYELTENYGKTWLAYRRPPERSLADGKK